MELLKVERKHLASCKVVQNLDDLKISKRNPRTITLKLTPTCEVKLTLPAHVR